MSWNWERLSETVRRLKMPAGEYAVNRIGYGLSRDPSSTADSVELLVTETGWRKLKERAWQEKAGARFLRHPTERTLTARRVEFDSIRHEISEVDGVPVVAVEPDPEPEVRSTWRDRMAGALVTVFLTAAIGALAYGGTLFFSDGSTAATWRHLSFQTSKVEAEVLAATPDGTCQGAEAWDTSPRTRMTLGWTQDGHYTVGGYVACSRQEEGRRDVWVTSDAEVASLSSPWRAHLWPLLLIGLVPFALIVMPFFERLRDVWHRRRTSA